MVYRVGNEIYFRSCQCEKTFSMTHRKNRPPRKIGTGQFRLSLSDKVSIKQPLLPAPNELEPGEEPVVEADATTPVANPPGSLMIPNAGLSSYSLLSSI